MHNSYLFTDHCYSMDNLYWVIKYISLTWVVTPSIHLLVNPYTISRIKTSCPILYCGLLQIHYNNVGHPQFSEGWLIELGS